MEPEVTIEIRWCTAHKGVAGNEKADEWVKIAADNSTARGVEGPPLSELVWYHITIVPPPVDRLPESRNRRERPGRRVGKITSGRFMKVGLDSGVETECVCILP